MTRSRKPAQHHGFLVIDKPAGWTSHDVVSRVRKITGERRVGHAGTLDPAATGALPIAVGLATRTVEYLSEATKSYRAEIVFGIGTDSYDRDGRLVRTTPIVGLAEEAVRKAVASLQGEQMQLPPAHSAIKVDGRRSFDLARMGVEKALNPRAIFLYRLEVVHWDIGRLLLDVTCSKGTYIRSVARDLGQLVGTGAYLASLIRTRSGPFSLSSAIDLEGLPELWERPGWQKIAWHPDTALIGHPVLIMDDGASGDWIVGKKVPGPSDVTGVVSVYDWRGIWVGVGQVAHGVCKPLKVVSMETLESANE